MKTKIIVDNKKRKSRNSCESACVCVCVFLFKCKYKFQNNIFKTKNVNQIREKASVLRFEHTNKGNKQHEPPVN